ncbi:MAG: MFS transporter [Opitutae bacterium]|nr:MFS transporter [Opitutae bacterium]
MSAPTASVDATPRPTALPEERVPWREKLAFGIGGILDNFGNAGLKNVANPIFNIVLGVSPALVGLMISISRVWDAFIDPLVGSASDNARTRWGRRKPFVAVGIVGCAVALPLMMFCPAGGSEASRFAWLMVTGLLFYAAYAVFVIPFNALAFEMTSDTHERTRVQAVKTVVAAISGVGIQWIFPLTQNGWLGDPVQSVRIVGLGLGVLYLLIGVVPLVTLKERLFRQAAKQAAVPLRISLPTALRSRPFRLLLLVIVLTHLGLNTVNALGIYVNVYYVHGGDAKAASIVSGWWGTVYLLSTIALTPAIAALSGRIGKRRALLVCLACVLTGSTLKWFLFTPAHPHWQLVIGVLLGPGLSGLWMLVPSMTMDIVDHEELQNGTRSDALYYAISAWVGKCGLALSLFLSGLLLVGLGFDAKLGAQQSATTLFWMRVCFAWLPALTVIVSLITVARFPLTTEKMLQVRAELLRRRQVAANA